MPKHLGSICDYRDERDKFLLATRKKLYGMVSHIDTPSIFKMLVKMPAPRLWISEQTAEVIIDKMNKGADLSKCYTERRRLYNYLYERFIEEKNKRPTEKNSSIIIDIIYSPAPESFISIKSIGSLMTRYKKRNKGIKPNIKNGKEKNK